MERKLPEIRVGANVLVEDAGKILLLKRKGGFGAGTWCFPGGHFEEDISIIEAAIREAQEEIGITVKLEDLKFITTSDKRQEDTVHIQFLYKVLSFTGRLNNQEPDNTSEMEFFDLRNLPSEIFPPHKPLIQYIQENSTLLNQ